MIFITCPTYDGRVNVGTAGRIFGAVKEIGGNAKVKFGTSSLLNWNCNNLWAWAWEEAKVYKNVPNYFVMVHADVVPQAGWLNTLVEIIQARKALMVSCIIPIKDDSGAFSTALKVGRSANPLRITKESLKQLPETFGWEDAVQPGYKAELLLNTGCCIVRMNEATKRIVFWSSDTINDGVAWTFSEDWHFSRNIGRKGLTLATRKVKCEHIGQKSWTF